jgi:hypothetical protein
MKKSRFLLPTLLLLGLSGACQADGSFRCGNSLISVGDPSAVLLIKCGRPLTIDSRSQAVIDDYGHRQIISTGEVWTMYLGHDRFMQLVTVEGGIIKNIEDGPRG